MSDLGGDFRAAVIRAADVPAGLDLSPAGIRSLSAAVGGNRELASRLGVTMRTVQRWQKEGGQARNVAKSTPGLKISLASMAPDAYRVAAVQQVRGQVRAGGLDVGACRVMVQVYNDARARVRSIGDMHIGGDDPALLQALDELEVGHEDAAGAAFGTSWLRAYGMDGFDADVTDVQGTLALTV